MEAAAANNEIKTALDKEGQKIKEALESLGYEYMSFDIEESSLGKNNDTYFRIRARIRGER